MESHENMREMIEAIQTIRKGNNKYIGKDIDEIIVKETQRKKYTKKGMRVQRRNQAIQTRIIYQYSQRQGEVEEKIMEVEPTVWDKC